MLLQLIVAATTALSADTVPGSSVELLGEPLEESTLVAEPSISEGLLPLASLTSTTAPEVLAGVPRPFASAALPPHTNSWLPSHWTAAPTDAGFTAAELERAMYVITDEVYRGGFPGAAVAVGRWNRTVMERGIGTLDRTLGSPAVDPDRTIYDLASLTKVVATTTAVMLLVEDGVMELNAPVSRYLPAFSGGGKERVTIRHLLTHTSGLPAGGNINADTPRESLERAIAIPLVRAPGARVEYSDIGFIVLWAAAEAAYGGSLEEMLRQRVYEPLGMWSTGFNPGEDCWQCAPTEDRPGFRGIVHDPLARKLGGVAGNAGLFSTVHDLSRFAAMLVNGGELDGVRVLQKGTIDLFTMRQPGAETRALGWDTPDEKGEGAGGLRISRSAFGHTGFTGTSLWVDPERGTWTVLLSNRTYRPNGPNRMQALRREVNDLVATAIDIGGR